MGAILQRTPHTVSLKRGAVSRDAGNNSAERDFAGASARNVKCLFQTRAGDAEIDNQGNTFSYDAVLFTFDEDVLINDLVTVAIPGTADDFTVKDRQPKYRMNGNLSHMEIAMERELKRDG